MPPLVPPLLEVHASQLAWDTNFLDEQLKDKPIEAQETECLAILMKINARIERERIVDRAIIPHLETGDNVDNGMPCPIDGRSREILLQNTHPKVWTFSLRQGFLPEEAVYKEHYPFVWEESLLDAFLALPAGCDMMQLRTGPRHAILARVERQKTHNNTAWTTMTTTVLQERDIRTFRLSHCLM